MSRGDMDEENIEDRDISQTSPNPTNKEESPEDSDIRRRQFEELKVELSKMLDSMHPREAGVIRARFGLDETEQKSLVEISEEFGVTIERIRQIESKTMSRLRISSQTKFW
jgi:RNA polymerase sigma factor (sigma-70 family)